MAAKFPEQTVIFASWNKQRDIRSLSGSLIGASFETRGDDPLAHFRPQILPKITRMCQN
jgi:hypothetical protein